jgi:hypothetical protein
MLKIAIRFLIFLIAFQGPVAGMAAVTADTTQQVVATRLEVPAAKPVLMAITPDSIKKAQQDYAHSTSRQATIRLLARIAALGAVGYLGYQWYTDVPPSHPIDSVQAHCQQVKQHEAAIHQIQEQLKQAPATSWLVSIKSWAGWVTREAINKSTIAGVVGGIWWWANACVQKDLNLAQYLTKTGFYVEQHDTGAYKLISRTMLTRTARQIDGGRMSIQDPITGTEYDLCDRCVENYNQCIQDITKIVGCMYHTAASAQDKDFAGKASILASQLVAFVNVQRVTVYQAIQDKKANKTTTTSLASLFQDLYEELTTVVNNFCMLEQELSNA